MKPNPNRPMAACYLTWYLTIEEQAVLGKRQADLNFFMSRFDPLALWISHHLKEAGTVVRGCPSLSLVVRAKARTDIAFTPHWRERPPGCEATLNVGMADLLGLRREDSPLGEAAIAMVIAALDSYSADLECIRAPVMAAIDDFRSHDYRFCFTAGKGALSTLGLQWRVRAQLQPTGTTCTLTLRRARTQAPVHECVVWRTDDVHCHLAQSWCKVEVEGDRIIAYSHAHEDESTRPVIRVETVLAALGMADPRT